ncbi:MAG: flagellin N-terminal helical domain-containing protein [Nocardioidaceae bacterium]
MGLRINQNIAAMNAYRNLSITDNQMSKSLEKLSSGFRINRAADDAAGLSISEGLRSQVGGLKQAVRNAQDGVNVVQTADGALTETHSILQRMRDLAVQASNTGSQDTNARQAAQTEFDQLNKELDRIGSTTSFGGQKLLDGSYGTGATNVTGYVTLAADADSVTAGNQPGVNVATGTNDQFTLAVGVKDASGASSTVTLTDITVAAPASGGGYTSAASFQKALQSAIDTSATGGDAAGKITASVTDTGDGHWKVGFSNSDGGAITASAGTNDLLVSGLGIKDGTNVAASTGGGGVFQVGANNSTNDKIVVSINAVDSGTLGTAGLDLVNSASSAISTIDGAIKSVSTTRANLGAYQNRFEHTINNLNVAVQNLSASESQIRDTDMAQEMTQFTRSQILSQAGTAMLAQANQASQGVLRLLQ